MGAVTEQATPYERFGGHEFFDTLVKRFYEGVATDEPLRALYPEEDLGPAEDRLRMFLEQYFGGPHTYSETRGHPRLRMRHAPYAVTLDQRERWLRHMLGALDTMHLPAEDDVVIRSYLVNAADFMVNVSEEMPVRSNGPTLGLTDVRANPAL